jgi:ribulose-phosphate 3-epimerase
VIEIIPAILTNNPNELREKLTRLEGVVDRVQIDVIDGKFADNKTVDLATFDTVETSLHLDFHLMVDDPISWVERSIRAGADRIIGQVEKMSDPLEFLAKCQSVGVGAGIAFDLDTPLGVVEAELIQNFDVVLLMAVPAGFGGQQFDERVLPKILDCAALKDKDNSPFRICVDGGETLETIDDTAYAGADEVAIGRRLFDGDIGENITKFQKASEVLE